MLQTKRIGPSRAAATFEELNRLMEAVALIIARRQMKRHWTTAAAVIRP